MADELHAISVTVNGELHEATVSARQLLVYFLRETLGLKGAHIGCDTGTCGACTVMCDGQAIKSCMMLAVQADDRDIETVEGLARDGKLSDVQQAFTDEHALQCGYCTPGMLIAVTHLLQGEMELTEAEIRRALKGNLCRCTGYHNIVRAVQKAQGGAR